MANPVFPAGDLVVSVSGRAAGDTTTYADGQGSPLTLEAINPVTGAIDQTLVLPQAPSGTNSAISLEYGSSSEGTLELSVDAQSLSIAGYGINAAAYNQAEAGFTKTTGPYGSNALAQTTSLSTASNAVTRVIADIRFDGTIDTSTALLNVDNANNPRSAATADGKEFYLAGQGLKGDTTQGLFYAADGSAQTAATAINNLTDNRIVEYGNGDGNNAGNGNIYVATDSKQGSAGYTANISMYAGTPTGAATPTILPGISQSVTLTAAQGNMVNGGAAGTAVAISPENFFFANPTTLYIADSGNPKGGTLGDGGLQKWTLGANGTWALQYTLSQGLSLVPDTATAGTTGLIGLTGKVLANGTVQLYATNATIGDTDPTFVYAITDPLAATTNPGMGFTQLAAAGTDSNIRGIAFAPTAAVCYCAGTLIRTSRGDVAVEDLVIGELAVTASGARRAIAWLGHRTVDCRGHHDRDALLPIRIAAHAFGHGRPARDLHVSPGHAICVDVVGEVLIPASVLVNGATVAQVEVDSVVYWHVELEGGHDILLAENLPAESYIDVGNRAFFVENGVTALAAAPDGGVAAGTCRPFVDGGALVWAVRERLRAQAVALGWDLHDDPLAGLHLVADGVVIEPAVHGLTACFVLSADAADVWLASTASVPADVSGSADTRTLGVALRGLAISDGANSRRDIAMNDPRLCVGFNAPDNDGSRRWTVGRARLPATLWSDCLDVFHLRVDLAGPALPHWRAPARSTAA